LLGERIGDLVRTLRTNAGMTQAELGDAIGLSRTSITNLEQGRQAIPTDTLVRILYTLGFDMEIRLVRINGNKRMDVAR
jgi:transcriptional regulator with XRE-family HTH domain